MGRRAGSPGEALRRLLFAAAACAPAVVWIAPATADAADPLRGPRRVLIVQSFGQHFEPFATAAATFRTELALRSPEPIDFYEISLETARFAEGDIDQPLADYVRVLSAERPLDLVVPIGSPALRFCVRHHERLFPDVPMLSAGSEGRHLENLDLGDHTTVVTFTIDLVGQVEDILHVLPGTTNIDVVLGSSPLEQYWVAEMRRAWRVFEGRVEFTWLNELTMAGMRERVAALPPNSAIIFALINIDAAGVPYEQNAALAALHEAASAPMFGFFEPELGHGIAGGRLVDVRTVGTEAARLAVRLLGGEPPSSIPPFVLPAPAPAFDWRELRRWGIREAQLPPGSAVRFREPTFLQNYRWHVVTLGALCAGQAVLIAMLLSNRRRLRRTRAQLGENERDVQTLRLELSQAARVSLLGQFTASLAHELGQPLGAILRNADAAELFLKRSPPDVDEVRAIVADVRRDGVRAGAVIDRLRAMLEQRGIETQTLVWGDVVDEVMGIVGSEAGQRGVKLAIDVPSGLPAVRGDRVHLQQVLINLVANAIDALEGRNGAERHVTVRARARDDGSVECSVADTGPGIPLERLGDVFDPYVTTKPHGMGMGLAISRTIVEAHGGRIWAENNADRGATFRFTIPVEARRAGHG